VANSQFSCACWQYRAGGAPALPRVANEAVLPGPYQGELDGEAHPDRRNFRNPYGVIAWFKRAVEPGVTGFSTWRLFGGIAHDGFTCSTVVPTWKSSSPAVW